MADAVPTTADMLLVEPVTLLRRTVSLTARTMGVARVHEAASSAQALRLLRERAFDGAVIAIEAQHDLALLDEVRTGATASKPGMPIAVMLAECDAMLLAALQARGVARVLLKPFKARNLLDTFAMLGKAEPAPAGPQGLYRVAPD